MKNNFKIRVCAFVLVIVLLLSLCSCKKVIGLNEIPEYKRAPYVEINGGTPFFEEDEITDEAFESYSPLDMIGRCGVAFACIGLEIMPTEDRGDIANITPAGWEYNGVSNNNSYDFVDGGYIYNRCHLIGFQLAGENDNPQNLITGTRYMNIEGMLPFENEIAEYVRKTENHVLYRVTPIFEGVDYVARGVLMEAYSVEDSGRGICFCIYAYNVQPGVTIDYFSGVNVESGEKLPDIIPPSSDSGNDSNGGSSGNIEVGEHPNNGIVMDYVLNTNSKKFHTPGKSCAEKISEKNREDYNGTRNDLIKNGYPACGTCKP